ncbi:MAG: InlB B-repeat-containing protein [Bacilli bacterium]|nr:InlB B-repeat-containing protein [Bacilli bacterium]
MKKRRLIGALALSAVLLGGSLTACGGGDGDGSGQTTGQKFKVTYAESEDYKVEGLKAEYKAGDEVSFTVEVLNPKKTLSSVRAGTIRPTKKDGVYSFEMPEEDVEIRIVLADKVAPEFKASYVGTTEIGSTLTFSATADEEAVSDFTLTATAGASLVTISGKTVKLNAAGDVTIKVSAKVNEFDVSADVSFTILPDEASLGTNITFEKKTFVFGTEDASKRDKAAWKYWAGDGGNVAQHAYDPASDEYSVTYSVGWAFYGVQFFYTLPYAEAGENYKARWEIETDAAGTITVSGKQIALVVGKNVLDLDLTQGNGATVSVQLGYMDGTTHVGMPGGTLKFKGIKIYDVDTTHVYQDVTFKDGSTVLRSIKVRDGKTVEAPEAPAKQNLVFKNWTDGDVVYSDSLAITKAYNFTANYVEKSDATIKKVTLMLNGNKLTEVEVATGAVLVLPENLNYGFGKGLAGLYRDAEFTQAFDLSTPINESMTLYCKTWVQFDSTYAHAEGLGWSIPTESLLHDADGGAVIKYHGWGSDGWHVQANFKNPPKGNDGQTVTINFTYSMNVAGGNSQVYDGEQKAQQTLEVGTRKAGVLSYPGGTLNTDGDYKLTFEFGAIELDLEYEFTLHDISVTIA